MKARKEAAAKREEERARTQEEREKEGCRIKRAEWTDKVVASIDFSDSPKSWEESVAQSYNRVPRPRGRFCVRATPTLRGVSPEGKY